MVQLSEPLSAEQIAALPVYDWEVARIGDEAPPLVYEVTLESIVDYCEAVRNYNPLYLDESAAGRGPFGGIIAPPAYAFKCAPLRRNEAMHARGFASPEEKGLRATPYAKAELFFRRPIRIHDEITSTVRLEDMYERRGNQFMTWRTRAVDQHGALVVDYTYTIIWRQGTPKDPASKRADSTPAILTDREPLPTVTKLESQEAIDRYAELTRLHPRVGSNLHTDTDFAQRTIFGGTVNMGPASAAYCSEVVELAFGPAALLRPGGRLEYKGIRPVRAGDEITLGGYITSRTAAETQCQINVHNQTGVLVGVGTATVLIE